MVPSSQIDTLMLAEALSASLPQGELLRCTPWQFIWKQIITGRCFENSKKIVVGEGNRGVRKSLSTRI